MGKLIIFEGLDGSGKGTQTKLTAQRLKEQGRELRQITFPDYESESSALVKMYLSGAFGDKPDDVNAYAASSFYAVDRFASYKTDWGEFYREGGLVLSDRYTTSNAVHQCSKLPPMHWDGFLQPRRRRVLRPHAGLASHRMHRRRRKRRKNHALRRGY